VRIGLEARSAPIDRTGWLVPVGLAILAGILRLVGLPGRGPWDADQGTHLLVMDAWVRDGVVPSLGPASSIGDLNHGALYYYLLAPAAFLSDTDPVAVTLTFVVAGVVAVLGTWWLARIVAGPVAGLLAGVLMAVSATSVAASTWIWNPNLVTAGSAVALAASLAAWTGRRPRLWVLAGVGLTVAVQCHLLAGLLVPPVAALWILDLRRAGGDRLAVVSAGIIGAAIVALGFVPLLIHDLSTGWPQVRALIELLVGGGLGSGEGPGIVTRILVGGWRILSWPLSGLVVDAPIVAAAVAALVVGTIAWRWRSRVAGERDGVRFLGLTVVWGWLSLGLAVPALGTVVRALPVDHYHTFLDPAVVALAATGLVAVARLGRPASWETRPFPLGPWFAAAGVAALLGWNLVTQPPLTSPDGGWPAGEVAGDRIVAAARGTPDPASPGNDGVPIAFRSLPDFKGPEAYVFPVVRDWMEVVNVRALPAGGILAIVCDDLFRDAIEEACGGPAEDAEADASIASPRLVDRFSPAPGRTISLYEVGGSP
jgi:hypothetical protein